MLHPLRIYLAQRIIHLLPETRFFTVKRTIYRWCGLKIGYNVRICSSVTIGGCGEITIGDNTWIGLQTMIESGCRIEIGANVDIGPRVYIGTGTHEITPEGSHIAGKGIQKPVFIGDGSWIGANATILPGMTIGQKAIIAAGGVVTHNVPNSTIVAGVPAKIIRHI